MTLHSGHFGCRNLLEEIQQQRRSRPPRLHIYGHIHEGYGTSYDGRTLFVNASNLDIGYEAINPCIVIDLPHDKNQPARVVQPICRLDDMGDFVGWLRHHNYLQVAEAVEKSSLTRRRMHTGDESGFSSLPMPQNIFSGSTYYYYELCTFLGWKRRKHKSNRRELRMALCQLHSESFL